MGSWAYVPRLSEGSRLSGPFCENCEPADWIGNGDGQCISSRCTAHGRISPRREVQWCWVLCWPCWCCCSHSWCCYVVCQQEHLRRRIEHGGNIDDKFLSNSENREYNVIGWRKGQIMSFRVNRASVSILWLNDHSLRLLLDTNCSCWVSS